MMLNFYVEWWNACGRKTSPFLKLLQERMVQPQTLSSPNFSDQLSALHNQKFPNFIKVCIKSLPLTSLLFVSTNFNPIINQENNLVLCNMEFLSYRCLLLTRKKDHRFLFGQFETEINIVTYIFQL